MPLEKPLAQRVDERGIAHQLHGPLGLVLLHPQLVLHRVTRRGRSALGARFRKTAAGHSEGLRSHSGGRRGSHNRRQRHGGLSRLGWGRPHGRGGIDEREQAVLVDDSGTLVLCLGNLGSATLGASQQVGGFATDAAGDAAAVALDEVICLIPLQRIQHARHHEGPVQQALRVPPCRLFPTSVGGVVRGLAAAKAPFRGLHGGDSQLLLGWQLRLGFIHRSNRRPHIIPVPLQRILALPTLGTRLGRRFAGSLLGWRCGLCLVSSGGRRCRLCEGLGQSAPFAGCSLPCWTCRGLGLHCSRLRLSNSRFSCWQMRSELHFGPGCLGISSGGTLGCRLGRRRIGGCLELGCSLALGWRLLVFAVAD
mmetsp:Transcript_687/g.1995  ORF Transcript_687/g.1995 Transcript_687/m.1995 type:complete len:365 (-) Transcript_687:772-1866(-)